MFCVTEHETALIQAAFDRGGELAAAVELWRLFPGIATIEDAQRCAFAVAGWTRPAETSER